MTHLEYIKYSQSKLGGRLSVPCSSVHLTFGGRCLNCGYSPDWVVCDNCGYSKKAGPGICTKCARFPI